MSSTPTPARAGFPLNAGKPGITPADYARAAARLHCSVAAVMAVAEVESRGNGFNPDGSPKTLFEAHQFHRLTQGRWDATHPTISVPKWDRSLYGATWQQEAARLALAGSLDRTAARQATSWGRFQVMGFNAQAIGFHDVDDFVAAMWEGEGRHLDAFVGYVLANRLDDELRDLRWGDFARSYNGPAYAINRYDVKLAAAYLTATNALKEQRNIA